VTLNRAPPDFFVPCLLVPTDWKEWSLEAQHLRQLLELPSARHIN
jgi:hypothetical protein